MSFQITLVGLLAVGLNFVTLLMHDAAMAGDPAAGPPRWVYFTWAAGLFLYQTMDAIDGYARVFVPLPSPSLVQLRRRKQARRTGMAGPLGEMFDHGVIRERTCACQRPSLLTEWQDAMP